MASPVRCLLVGLSRASLQSPSSLSLVFRSLLIRPTICLQRATARSRPTVQLRSYTGGGSPLDQQDWVSVIEKPQILVRHNKKRNPFGLTLLALIPITAFALGTWQVYRLEWKTNLVARYEDRLVRPPLPLPPYINTTSLDEFDYRRIVATGKFRYDEEMFVGPRIYDGENGYFLITPLERPNGSKILVNRGWIAKDKRDQKSRDPEAFPAREVAVQGLLRSGWKRNFFTPENRPDLEEFYFPDVEQMAGLVRAQPVWVEETMDSDYITVMDRKSKGIPIGRVAEVDLRNNHLQYVVTWYALSAATTLMFYLLVRRPPADVARRVRQNKEWS